MKIFKCYTSARSACAVGEGLGERSGRGIWSFWVARYSEENIENRKEKEICEIPQIKRIRMLRVKF